MAAPCWAHHGPISGASCLLYRPRYETIVGPRVGSTQGRSDKNTNDKPPYVYLPFYDCTDAVFAGIANTDMGDAFVSSNTHRSYASQDSTYTAPLCAVEPSSRPARGCDEPIITTPSSAVELVSRPAGGCDDYHVVHDTPTLLPSSNPSLLLPHGCAHVHLHDSPSVFSKRQQKLLKFHYKKLGWAWDGGIRHTRSTGSFLAHTGTIAISHRHAPAIVKRIFKRR
jgi:hypothetical protein